MTNWFWQICKSRQCSNRMTSAKSTPARSFSVRTYPSRLQVIFTNDCSQDDTNAFLQKSNALFRSPSMLVDPTGPSDDDFLLDLENFPSNFVDGYHPDDGKFDERPITPEYLVHDSGCHLRLFLRISFLLLLNKTIRYFPVSFIIDTGEMEGISFTPRTKEYFREIDRITKIDDEVEWIVIDYRSENRRQYKAIIKETPQLHQAAPLRI